MSQEEMGYQLKVTRQTISKWELGQTTPEMDKVIEIAKLFGITLDELMNENDIQYNENKNSKNNEKSESEKSGKSKINTILIMVLIILIILGIGFGIGFGVKKLLQSKEQKELQDKAEQLTNEVLTQGIEAINQIKQTTDEQINSSEITNSSSEHTNSNIVEENFENVQEQMIQVQEQINQHEMTTQQQELLDRATEGQQHLLQQMQ